MKPPNESRAGRLLHAVQETVFRHPRWFWWAQIVLVVFCVGYAVANLQFSTSRDDLISVRESYRRHYLEFRREFNIHDNFFVLVESENRDRNREFVERLAERIQADSRFAGALYRGGLKMMGDKALLFLPEETLAELKQNLHTFQPFFQAFAHSTNLNTFFGSVNRQFRTLGENPDANLGEAALANSVRTLQRVVDSAVESVQSAERPLAPNILTLFSTNPGETRPYLTFEQGRIYLLITQARDPAQEASVIKDLRKLLAEVRWQVPGVNADLTGEAVLRHDEMRQARRDTELAALIALVLTGIIFIASCRAVVRPLMATFCLLVGICYAVGFATLTVGRFNILSITLVPILIGLAIDYGVHVIFRYEEQARRGETRRLAIEKAIGFTGVGVITNALTIAGAFYFMMLTDFKGMQEMGFIAGSGALLCLIPMLTLLPLLLARGKPNLPDPSAMRRVTTRSQLMGFLGMRSQLQRSDASYSSRAQLEQLYLTRPWLVLGAGTALTVIALAGLGKVEFDYDLLNLQSRGLPAVRTQKQLMAGSQSPLYCAVVADSLTEAAEWEQRINQLPSVARVISLVRYLTEDQDRKLALISEIKREVQVIPTPELDPAPVDLAQLGQTLFSLSGYLGLAVESGPANVRQNREAFDTLHDSVNRLRQLTAIGDPAVEKRLTKFQRDMFHNVREAMSLIRQQNDQERLLPGDVPEFLRELFVSRSGKFLLQVYPKEDVWQRDAQERFIRELRIVDPMVTGSPVQFYEYTSRLKENVERAAIYAAIVITIVVFLHFRRLASVVLVLLPVALGFCWMLGLMGWLRIPLNPVNIVSVILLIGIGVTNGVHILNRFAEDPSPDILSKSTGKAVLVSALNTIAGFGSLLVAQHQGIASFGGVMAIGTATCVVASLTVLPAVLTVLPQGWLRRRSKGQ